jgi:23S rRNA (uracil1939-C5)-methyltransferase
MKTFKSGDRFEVHIDRLSVGGRGVARHEGLVVFVADTAPGEAVEVELALVKKNFAEARLVRIVTPSLSRITPPCPVAGICGGCNWQHVAYDEQLRQKKSLVEESLKTFSGFQTDDQTVSDVVASPSPFRYRNRIQLHYSGPRMGFFKRASHEIVDIVDCPITEESLAQQIPKLKKDYAQKKTGRIELSIRQNGTVSAVHLEKDLEKSQQKEDEGAPDVAGPAFSQVNTAQNRQLVEYVVTLAVRELGVDFRGELLDLYAGSGNFTLPLAFALPHARITGVELNSDSVLLARKIAEKDFSSRELRFEKSDVASYLQKARLDSRSFVLLDPPRTGCGPEVIASLVAARPRRILYVSCHPVTLARDLKQLAEAGYKLGQVAPFDMFPQTDHVETVAFLTIAPELKSGSEIS